jgi:diadenylate cyclase
LSLQLEELTGGLSNDLEWLIRDYLPESRSTLTVDQAVANLTALDSAELLDLSAGARALGFTIVGDSLDSAVSPLGYRLLNKVPRLPAAVTDRLVEHFFGLQKLLAANIDELMEVDGIGEGRARLVREGLSRLAESSILERYV